MQGLREFECDFANPDVPGNVCEAVLSGNTQITERAGDAMSCVVRDQKKWRSAISKEDFEWRGFVRLEEWLHNTITIQEI